MSRNSHKSKGEFCPVLEHVDVNVDVKTLYLPQELVDHI